MARIISSYATGDPDGGSGHNDRVGGLVGKSEVVATITSSYATGSPSGGGGNDRVGGLVGELGRTKFHHLQLRHR